jgi:muramoyltetrapeptide carboxypeptidase
MTIPPYLKAGDTVAVVSTSNFTKQEYIDRLVRILTNWELKPLLGKTIGARQGSFAGPDELRRKDLQEMLDNGEVKAVFETMGGYGILRILDQLDFNKFKYQPKWLVGYSDTTFLHSHVQGNLGIASLQATMAADLEDGYNEEAWESLRKALFGQKLHYQLDPHPLNRAGKSEAVVVGGTLSILCNAKGTFSDVNTNGKILFLEEVGEHYFRLDSYITSMKQAGKFEYVKGLMVGYLRDLQEDHPPFGKTPEEIIREAVEEYDFPICFGFPAGHAAHNVAIPFGTRACIEVSKKGVQVEFLENVQKITSSNAEA